MALITFDVIGAVVSSRMEHGKADWHVTLHLALAFNEHLTLATGEDVRTIRLTLTLKAMTPETDGWLQERRGKPDQPIIGQMHYFDGPPAILSDANVSLETFDRILGLVQAGRAPDSLTIEVQNLTYDWRPDGSGKVWDNTANDIVPVTNVSFDVPVAGPAKEGEPDRMSERAKLIRESVTLQKWTLGALIVAAAVLAFGR